MKDEKFNKEINEETIPDSTKNPQVNLFEAENKNQVPSVSEPKGNDTSVQAGANETTETGSALNADEKAGKGKETKTEEKVKDGRGRKALSDEEKLKRANERKAAQNSLVDDLSKYKSATPSTSTATTQQATQDVKIDLSKYISGALLLIVMDAVFPSAIILIAGYVDKKYKYVDKSKLKLEKDEKKELEPLADEMIKIFFGMVHPAVAFFVCSGLLYAGKLMSLEESDFIIPKQIEKNKQNEKNKQIEKTITDGSKKTTG